MKPPHSLSSNWSLKDANRVYGIDRWGKGLFRINEQGEVSVYWNDDGTEVEASLVKVLELAHREGINPPVLLRFPQILSQRIRLLNESFQSAIEDLDYGNHYRGVFPVKVNQQHQVIRDIATFGRPYHYGFEVGSKAELVAALPYLNNSEAYLICNGYKDRAFIRLALQAAVAGHRIVPIIERPRELNLILEESEKLGVDPEFGIRVRLSTVGKGYWVESSGEQSLFGLNVAQVFETVEALRASGRLDCLKCLHFHQGSQLPDIQSIRESVSEAVHVYTGLIAEGAPMGILNLGGGLAVDYDGTRSSESHSRNYEIDEYCHAIVDIVKRVTDEAEVDPPILMTESGRAIAAHYSILALDVLDVNTPELPERPRVAIEEGWDENISALNDLIDSMEDGESLLPLYHEATFRREEIRSSFALGAVSLRERAVADQLFWHLVTRIRERSLLLESIPGELSEIEDKMADIYYGNFSVFQSLPDNWAIHQQFPVMPLHRHLEEPTRTAVVADLTCDCDGKLDLSLGNEKAKRLPVHKIRPDEEYLIGVFMVGAYQETLSDMHNLFGDTHAVSVDFVDGELALSRKVLADRIEDILRSVEYDPERLVERMETLIAERVVEGKISNPVAQQFVENYRRAMNDSTYFDHWS
ncbi:MAG: biosynthetic arginine decarboxylase [Verrucomicrobiales bacterium]|nr:biosynthetic arginine decarboxylase [Verrucomicrobiales bacterium]